MIEIDKKYDEDWGAAGLQWSGLQVQAFIKQQLKLIIQEVNKISQSIGEGISADVATDKKNGLMSATDKANLDALWGILGTLPKSDGKTYGFKNQAIELLCDANESVFVGATGTSYDPVEVAEILTGQSQTVDLPEEETDINQPTK